MSTPWKQPVVINLGEPPVETAIDSVQAAAWAMIEDWPTEDGAALDRALLLFAAIDAGKRKPEDGRKAFVDAAVEAGILIRA